MISKKADSFSTDFLPKYWTEVWGVWRTDLRPGFWALSTSPRMLESRDWFAGQTGVIPEDSQGHAMIQVLVWGTMLDRGSRIDLKVLLECWMTSWLDLLRLSLRQERETDLLWSIGMFSNWLSSKEDGFDTGCWWLRVWFVWSIQWASGSISRLSLRFEKMAGSLRIW